MNTITFRHADMLVPGRGMSAPVIVVRWEAIKTITNNAHLSPIKVLVYLSRPDTQNTTKKQTPKYEDHDRGAPPRPRKTHGSVAVIYDSCIVSRLEKYESTHLKSVLKSPQDISRIRYDTILVYYTWMWSEMYREEYHARVTTTSV